MKRSESQRRREQSDAMQAAREEERRRREGGWVGTASHGYQRERLGPPEDQR